ncbi:MAG: hypothetical protein HeimC3_23730 [Candidatus Heimdallarchaeota archaeon LC_3]|nr:MAG: hypothetical protein HeimC3_23730 [Candidatus Heimdallarchaeota archaeon LC_3]
MLSQVSFTWKSKQGIGILFLLIGWTIIFQVIPVIHTIDVLNFGNNFDEQLIIFSGIFLTTVFLVAIIGSSLENLYSDSEMYSEGLVKVTLLLFIIMICYEVGYLFAVPFLGVLSPFLQIDIIADLEGISAYVVSILLALILPALFWGISETIPESNILRRKKSS